MLETGDFVRIMNGTEPRNRKPIGIYWLQLPFAAAARATGVAIAQPGLALSDSLAARRAARGVRDLRPRPGG